MIDLKKHIIYCDEGIIKALKLINEIPKQQTLFVLDKDEKLVGTVTDGDIRRGFIKGLGLEDKISRFMKIDFAYLDSNNYNQNDIRKLKSKGLKLLPLIDNNKHITGVIDLNIIETILPVDAVLMAGGRGERLRPLTDTVPKPLLKIASKPILEHNIDRMIRYGITDYHISIRYLGDQIEEYFGNGNSKNINIKYIKETNVLGTIGAVSQVEGFNHEHILLMNSDLFTNIDFEEFFNAYIEENADLAIATIPYNINVPYAILSVKDNNDEISGLKEKPFYTYYANAGIYLFRRELKNIIPKDIKYDATDFITELIKRDKKIIKFTIYGYWFDIGNMEDFNKVNSIASHIKI